MKKVQKGLISAVLILVACVSILKVTDLKFHQELSPQNKRERFEQFIHHHPYANRELSEAEMKSLPKKDRPDLAAEQNFLMIVDPNTLTVPYERVMPAFEYTKARLKAKKAANKDGKAAVVNVAGEEAVWEERGPNNVGGRTRAIMWDPNDANNQRVFAGGIAGGLWVNDNILDENTSWTVIDDFLANLAISTLAYDPTDTDIFYAGTGEGWFNIDAVRGNGIMTSTDGGDSWSFLASTSGSEFHYVQKIVVTGAGTVLAATRASSGSNEGIFRSTNDGDTWTRVVQGNGADIEIATNGDIYASLGILSTGEVFKSSNDGVDWTDITPTDDADVERIELATAPSNSDVVYAIAQDVSTFGIGWIKRSDNSGDTWTDLAIPTHNQFCDPQSTDITRDQAWYDLILAVAPNDESRVIVGGVDLALSTNGGSSWTQISEFFNCSSIEDVHADHHQIVYRPGSSSEALFGNDGGIYYSPDAGTASNPSFDTRNKDYNVTQFYAVAGDNVTDSDYFLAGAQDNGTQQFSTANGLSTFEVNGGDGTFAHVDQLDRDFQLASSQFGNVVHSSNGGNSFRTIDELGTGNFINQSDYDDEAGILYSTADADELGLITNVKSNSPSDEVAVDVNLGGAQTSAIRANANTANRLFVGTEAGSVFRIDNANTNNPTSTDITSNISSLGSISSIDIGSSDDELIVTYSNFGVTSVWYTVNGGDTWVSKDDADHGLPDIPVRWVLFNPENTEQVLLATELGVWSTNDITADNPGWEPSNEGLANVRCDMLHYRPIDGQVVVATHGRGLFTTDIFATTPGPSVADAIENIEVFENPDPNPIIVDLSNTFTDSDNDDSLIEIAVVSNSNEALVTVSLTEKELSLTIAPNSIGEADIVLRATSGGKTVDEAFKVIVDESIPELFVQSGERESSSISQIFPDIDDHAVEVADDFVVETGSIWAIRRVFVEGSVTEAVPESAVLYIFEDDNGLPGDIVYESDILSTEATAGETDIKLNFSGDESIILGPGTYWLSVQAVMNVGDDNNLWGWDFTNAAGNDDFAFQDTEGIIVGSDPTTWVASGEEGALLFSLFGDEEFGEIEIPATPIATEATNVTETGFTANWTTNDDTEDFVFDLSNDDFQTFVEGYEGQEVTGFSLAITELEPDQYQYRVRGVNILREKSDNSNTITVEVGDILSVINSEHVAIYPNPSSGVFNIEMNPKSKVEIEIFALTGQKVKMFSFDQWDGNHKALNLSDQKAGAYLLKVSINNKSEVFRLLKK